MGLFNRFRSTRNIPAESPRNQSDAVEQNASSLIDEGNAIEDAGRLDEALQRYDEAIRLAPKLARGYLNRGNVLFAKGDLEAALAAYSAAIICDPEYPAAHFNAGNTNAQLGRHEAALKSYHESIRLKPDFIEAEIALGVVLENQGRNFEAAPHYVAALKLSPTHAEVSRNLENILIKVGEHMLHAERYTEIETWTHLLLEQNPTSGFFWKLLGASLQLQNKNCLLAMQKAVDLLPHDAEAQSNLSVVLTSLGRFEDAALCCQSAIAIKPNLAEAHGNLGNALVNLGLLDEAVESYRHALEIKPNYAEAHNNLGNTLQQLGLLDAAAASCRRALEINPNFVEAHNSLGNILRTLGQLDNALASYRLAINISPYYAEAHSNLGNVLHDLGKFDASVASYRCALKINPNYVEAHNNLGNTLGDQGRLDEAVTCFRRALAIKPDYFEAHSNLGNTLKDLGQLDAAVASYRHALEIKPDNTVIHSNLLFSFNLLAENNSSVMLAEANRYGEQVQRQASPYVNWQNTPEPTRRLRVGLVSGDFRQHPVGNFLENMLAALASHAKGRLEFFAYSNHFCVDTLTERIKASCHGWQSAVGLPDENLAKQIRQDGIDILLDLSGHTAHNRLPVFAWKPAPVQATWLGYLATTGVAAMDYLIADAWTLPEPEEINFTESIWRLPETYLCFTPPDKQIDSSPLPALANGYITFGSFNNLAKMNDAVVALWARVLKSVPDSRLYLKAKQLADASVRENIIKRFAAHDVGADRLIMKHQVPRTEYLTPYQEIDIALDPFPYQGITTSVEALWMGVPVLTLAGERFLSRQGIGLLMNAGMPEWIAADLDDYVARAVMHANDLQGLAALRNRLRKQVLASPIFDAPRFAHHFEAALRGMWQEWCRQSHQNTHKH